jgi:hypothetical protein
LLTREKLVMNMNDRLDQEYNSVNWITVITSTAISIGTSLLLLVTLGTLPTDATVAIKSSIALYCSLPLEHRLAIRKSINDDHNTIVITCEGDK